MAYSPSTTVHNYGINVEARALKYRGKVLLSLTLKVGRGDGSKMVVDASILEFMDACAMINFSRKFGDSFNNRSPKLTHIVDNFMYRIFLPSNTFSVS